MKARKIPKLHNLFHFHINDKIIYLSNDVPVLRRVAIKRMLTAIKSKARFTNFIWNDHSYKILQMFAIAHITLSVPNGMYIILMGRLIRNAHYKWRNFIS